ncbi:hypothetical protein [Xylanimonas oleitrophica]|uniref:hypothetical protein n=1 Tax=Xylanimonas oleitrophica TaxID=2607479 RepID=UPI0015D027C2|nr:hypothetical protein [Xylanimonas oleitrophica]
MVGALTAVVLVAAGTGAVVHLVDRLGARPVSERCAADLDGTDWYLSLVQAENAALVAGTALQRGMPARAATIGLATALQESKLVNITYGDRDSLGLFQQRPSQGWGTPEQVQDPVHATGAFYDALARVPGYEEMEVTVAAQTVQRSGFPDAYAQHETRSRAWASALTGHSPAALSCELDPVPDDETLASDVAVQRLQERALRDLGLPAEALRAGEDEDGVVPVTVDAAGLPLDEAAAAAWAVAHWAVATASVTDVVEVRVEDRLWTREGAVRAARDYRDAWERADGAGSGAGDGESDVQAGTVELRVAVTD